MPTNIRAILSVIVALVALAAYYFESQAETDTSSWYVLALGLFMIGAVWLFPEAKGLKKGKK